MNTTVPAALEGRRILLVEDEYFIVDDMVRALEASGAGVIGPVASVDDALDLIETTNLDGAVLDLNLRGEMAYPVADALIERGVPFVFATGYDKAMIPPRYAHVTRLEKPVETDRIARALFG
jgi:ActR/RegA family two-component response regulator